MRLRRTFAALLPLTMAATAGSVALTSAAASAATGIETRSASSPATSPATSSATTAATSTAAVPAAIAQQKLNWVECYPDAGYPELQCTAVLVPRDWAQPDGPQLIIAVSRIKATTPAQRKGVLFTNPGGPGGSGLSLPIFIEQSEPSVQNVYDVIGMDPRGVGESTQLNCGDGVLDPLYNLDGRDTSAANQARFTQLNRSYAKQCSANPLTPYITTDQTVRDMDLVRSLLGEKKINYLGFSAGTSLGTWYAARFPDRVGRFVLDGNTAWSLKSEYTGALQQPPAFQNSWENHFQPWAATYDSTYGLGATKKAVDATYEKRRAALAKQPLTLTDGSQLTASGYDSGIAGGMYWIGYYPELARVLQLVEHYATASADEQQEVTDWFAGVSGNGDDVFWAVSCQDTPQPSWSRVQKDTALFRKYAPLIGANWNVYPCPFFTTGTGQTPVVASELPAMLMLNNTDDPATPYPGALVDHAKAPKTVLVTIKNQPDHTIYGSGSDCADSKVNTWLVSGKLPSRDTSCPAVPLPEPEVAAAAASTLEAAAASTGGMTAQAFVQQFGTAHGSARIR